MSKSNSLIWSLLSAGAAAQPEQAAAPHTWETLAAAYAYDATASAHVTEERQDDPEHYASRLTFRKGDGASLAGLFLRPRAEGVYPCVLLLHALSSDKEAMIRLFGRALAQRGFACLALDAHLHGERRGGYSQELGPLEYLGLARESIVEYRQALDHLRTRRDVDGDRVGLLGYSLGAMMGCILAGVDERVGASVFMVGGDMVRDNLHHVPASLRELLEPVSPASFVGRISPRPVLFINGKWDNTVPRSAATLLHEAAGEPKQVIWADAGHTLAPEVAALGVEWLVEQLGQR